MSSARSPTFWSSRSRTNTREARRGTRSPPARFEPRCTSGARRKNIKPRVWNAARERQDIVTDSGISRGEFKRRPGLIAVANAAEDKAFDIVVTRDESRLRGDMHRVGL